MIIWIGYWVNIMIQLVLQQDHVIYSQNQDIINVGYLLTQVLERKKENIAYVHMI